MPPTLDFSAETAAVRDYMIASGVPFRVTSTTGGIHAPTSFHYRRLALDLAGPTPSRDSPALMAIFNALAPAGHQLTELIYARAPWNIRNGRRVPLYARAAHHDHIHVAVPPGRYIRWPGTPANIPIIGGADKVTPEFDPPLARFVSWLNNPAGPGGWGMSADGAIYALGGAPYMGGANGKGYFTSRTAAKLWASDDPAGVAARNAAQPGYQPAPGGYMIQATSDEWYGPGF